MPDQAVSWHLNGRLEWPLLANNGLPGHVAGASTLLLTADIVSPAGDPRSRACQIHYVSVSPRLDLARFTTQIGASGLLKRLIVVRRSAVRAGQRLVDLILQDMRGAEYQHAPRQDGDLFAGHRIAPDALALLANREAAE